MEPIVGTDSQQYLNGGVYLTSWENVYNGTGALNNGWISTAWSSIQVNNYVETYAHIERSMMSFDTTGYSSDIAYLIINMKGLKEFENGFESTSLVITDASSADSFSSLKNCTELYRIPLGDLLGGYKNYAILLSIDDLNLSGTTKFGFRVATEYDVERPSYDPGTFVIAADIIYFSGDVYLSDNAVNVMETLPAKAITKHSAIIGGKYTAPTSTHVEMGLQWKPSTTSSWTTYWWAKTPNYIDSDLIFWYTLSGLNVSRTYNFRAFYKVGSDYYYGSTLSFTTLPATVVFSPGFDYRTAKQALDTVSKIGVGRYYADGSGNFQYESRLRRNA
jgi:hypothetical protein